MINQLHQAEPVNDEKPLHRFFFDSPHESVSARHQTDQVDSNGTVSEAIENRVATELAPRKLVVSSDGSSFSVVSSEKNPLISPAEDASKFQIFKIRDGKLELAFSRGGSIRPGDTVFTDENTAIFTEVVNEAEKRGTILKISSVDVRTGISTSREGHIPLSWRDMKQGVPCSLADDGSLLAVYRPRINSLGVYSANTTSRFAHEFRTLAEIKPQYQMNRGDDKVLELNWLNNSRVLASLQCYHLSTTPRIVLYSLPASKRFRNPAIVPKLVANELDLGQELGAPICGVSFMSVGGQDIALISRLDGVVQVGAIEQEGKSYAFAPISEVRVTGTPVSVSYEGTSKKLAVLSCIGLGQKQRLGTLISIFDGGVGTDPHQSKVLFEEAPAELSRERRPGSFRTNDTFYDFLGKLGIPHSDPYVDYTFHYGPRHLSFIGPDQLLVGSSISGEQHGELGILQI